MSEKTSDNALLTKAVEKRRAGGAPKGNGNAYKHGLYTMKRAVIERGLAAIDGRSAVGRALSQWRADLIRDLGGQDTISTQQEALVDLAVKSKLLLDSVDVWLLQQPSLVNKRKKSLLPVVRERQQLADGLARYLGQLGLEKKIRQKTLQELLAEGSDDGDGQDEEGGEQGGDPGGEGPDPKSENAD